MTNHNGTLGLSPIGSILVKPTDWLVRNVLEANTMTTFFGEPGCGKSFIGIDLSCCIATGQFFHGFACKVGPVVYLAGEGHAGISRRFHAWGMHKGIKIDKSPIFLSSSPASLADSSNIQDTINEIATATDNVGYPVLVVVDTMARNFGPGDENSTKEMSEFVRSMDALRACFHCAIIIIHHTGHGDKSRGRGAGALRAALDAEYRVVKSGYDQVMIENTKMKDHPLSPSLYFTISPITLNKSDSNGDAITSAVLLPIDPPDATTRTKAGKGKTQVAVLSELKRLCNGGGKISTEAWKIACLSMGIKINSFNVAKKTLEQGGKIKMKDLCVYPC